MTDIVKTFKAAGAQSVGGAIFLNRVEMALLRNGQVILTPEGAAELQRLTAPPAPTPAPEVLIAEVKVPAKRKGGLKVEAPPPAPVTPPATASLDDLLNEAG